MPLSRSVVVRLLSICLVAAVGMAGGRLAAQRGAPPAGQQQPPPFRATTDVVLLDVSVLDKNRHPVRGLTKDDFTVFEDDVKQDVATFTAIDLPDADVPTAKWMSHTPLDVQTNAMPDGRLILIYLDERQPTNDPFATKGTKDAAHAIVDQLSPKDVAAVGFMLDHQGAQEFTTDRARLHAAIDTFAPAQPVGVPLLGVLRDLSNLFVSLPERRKIIIYIGMGQPYDLEVLAGMDKMTTHTDASVSFYQQGQQQQYNNLLSLVQAANRANVSIYTIDPIGLDNSSPSDPHKEFLRLVANTTGARAVIGNNQPASQVPLILGENASYYLLAFKPSNPSETGKFRRIEVKVDRPGLEVRARRGYVEGRTAGASLQAGVNPALGRLIPATQLSLGLWAQPATMEASGEHNVAMMIDVTLPQDGARPNEHLAVAWSIVDMSGKDRGTGRQDLTVSPPAAASDDYVATVQALANLPPGHYDIRVSAQLVERNRRGGLLGDVAVPDYAKDALSTSGVFVGLIAPASGPGNQLARFLAVKPTTDRTFAASEPIVAAMRVYQAKQPVQPVTVRATILDAKDKVVFDNSQRLEAAPFTTEGSADFRLTLPLSQLGPGAFLLRLEASRAGATVVRREVPFSVK
jgi:VWFA-related protein